MEVAVSVENQPLATDHKRLRAGAGRHRWIGLWLAGLFAISVTIGCGKTAAERQMEEAAAQVKLANEQAEPSPSEVQAAIEEEQADFLTPDDVQIPDLATVQQRRGKGIPDDALILDLGGNVRSYASTLPFPIVAEQGQPLILLGEDNGKLWITAKFFDKDGKLVCQLVRNELRLDDKHAFWTELGSHSLTLYENEAAEGEAKKDDAKVVLSVNFLNDKAVRLTGDFYSPKGVHVVIDDKGVVFGDHSLSATGLNGTFVNLDPPAAAVADSKPATPDPGAPEQPKADDHPAVTAEAADTPDATDVGGAMITAAEAFLALLTPDETAKAVMDFDNPARLDWSNIPKKDRKGLPILEMNDAERKACHQLLRSALSAKGYEQAVKIMSLENNLREGEKNLNTGWDRNPRRYYLTIFGKPDAAGTWGWSLEGHHLSLNFVVRDGVVISDTPSFWGANPATVKIVVPGGPAEGTRTLEGEEQLAFDLLGQLTDSQRAKAVISDTAPPEYRNVGTPQPPQTPPEGLPAADMTDAEKQTLRELLAAYAGHLAPALAKAQLADIDGKNFDRVHFAWWGPTKPGVGHYYRIQGPSFLLELINYQSDPAGNPANHIHSVWRSLDGDFGVAAN